MANYKDIHGTNIETVTSDPDNPVNGQVWYNSTDRVLKGFTSNPAGSWSSGGNVNTARYVSGGSGTQTAALMIAGATAPPNVKRAYTESYNGSSWTEVADLNTARLYGASSGTSTSALYFGGDDGATPTVLAVTESWDGTSWTEVGDLNEARSLVSGGGTTNTSALAFGGYPGSGRTGKTESYNGSSWTELTDLSTARGRMSNGPMGTKSLSLAVSGHPPSMPLSSATEEWSTINTVTFTTS